MKTTLKRISLLLCSLCLLLAMTGCERADYVAAVEVYNSGDYAQAKDLFLALGEYENAAELAKRCEYHLAVALYAEGKFQEAIPALEKLGDYEDSKALITHSQYQIALQLKDSKDYDAAQAAFEALEGYENSADHIADICWSRFYDTIVAASQVQEDGKTYRYTVSEDAATVLTVSSEDPYSVSFCTETLVDDGLQYLDSLQLTFHYPVSQAEYAALSKFTLVWNEKEYGSTQNCSGKLDPAEISFDTVLKTDNYQQTTNDIQDETQTSSDASDNSMEEAMAVNLQTLLTDIPAILQTLDTRFTPDLLGLSQFA